MEGAIKAIVFSKLYQKYGRPMEIAEEDWQEAKKDALNDIYANRLCFGKGVSIDYFSDLIVSILSINLDEHEPC